jgi:hypothetical protein
LLHAKKRKMGYDYGVHTQNRSKITKYIGLCALTLILLASACTTGGEIVVQDPNLDMLAETAIARVTEVHAAQATPELAPAEPLTVLSSPEINPLTGLAPSSPELLDRRPIIVKVQNLPRPRLQWGISAADLVFEYYTEFGTTRFAAIYYGQNPHMVAPIRSARWMDMHLVRMYDSIFVFGSAYNDLLKALFDTEFSERVLIEHPGTCPAICRYDPNGKNYLMTDLSAMGNYLSRLGVDNSRQDLNGMVFDAEIQQGGEPAEQVFAKFSAAVYNRWDYDPGSGRYLRFADIDNARLISDEKYEPLVDQNTGQQIGVENVVVVLAEYELLIQTAQSEVFDVALTGSGMAYLLRDGRLYNVRWQREDINSPLTLVDLNGVSFPYKPGQTWFEVMGLHTDITRDGNTWRFQHKMP